LKQRRKQRKNEALCIYCGAPSATRDHVPPRLLLEKPYPADLDTVPSCRFCNEGWSLDEQYFLILLSQIGTTPALLAKLEDGAVVDRALARAPRLDQRIVSSLKAEDDGIVYVAPERQRMHRVITKIAHGLYVLRYGVNPGPAGFKAVGVFPYNISDTRPVPVFLSTTGRSFREKRWTHLQRGVFSSVFVRNPTHGPKLWCVMDFHSTAWGVVSASFPSRQMAMVGPHLLLL
jgi:hypothetical protein